MCSSYIVHFGPGLISQNHSSFRGDFPVHCCLRTTESVSHGPMNDVLTYFNSFSYMMFHDVSWCFMMFHVIMWHQVNFNVLCQCWLQWATRKCRGLSGLIHSGPCVLVEPWWSWWVWAAPRCKEHRKISIVMGVSLNVWFWRKNPIKIDDLGIPFSETPRLSRKIECYGDLANKILWEHDRTQTIARFFAVAVSTKRYVNGSMGNGSILRLAIKFSTWIRMNFTTRHFYDDIMNCGG